MTMRVLELYSGIGGMHYAFQESGIAGEIAAAVDINTVANQVYRANFPGTVLMNRNIQSLTVKEINKLNVDVVLMSPPCQPFTRTGLQKDASDNRTSSFFHVLQLIPEIQSLKYILLENVRGFENSQTRDELVACLRNSGFNYKEFILSPCQFGIPNTRHRYYMLARRNDLRFPFTDSVLEYDLPKVLLNALPKGKHCKLAETDGVVDEKTGRQCYRLSNILENDVDTQYLIPGKLLQKYAWILDIRTAESSGSCCFTKAYGHYIEGTGSVYCPFSQETITEKYNESTKYEKDSEERMRLLNSLKLRYFTPKEVSRLMCFPEGFSFPENVTDKQRYRLLGNSINVHVVSKLIFLLCTEIENI